MPNVRRSGGADRRQVRCSNAPPHRAEDDESTNLLRQAEEAAEQVRAEVTQPLTVQAAHDGAAYLAAVEDEATASARLATVGRFGRRKARAERRTATESTQALRGQVSSEWGNTPTYADRLPGTGQAPGSRTATRPRDTTTAWPRQCRPSKPRPPTVRRCGSAMSGSAWRC